MYNGRGYGVGFLRILNTKYNIMTSDRIREIQETTAYPESVSVKQALLQVWNECEQERVKNCSIPNVVRSGFDFNKFKNSITNARDNFANACNVYLNSKEHKEMIEAFKKVGEIC